jgi:hypothetical protein
MRRALRQQRDSDKPSAGQEGIDVAHRQAGVEEKTYLIIIGSTHKEQNQRTKMKLALWDGVMVVLHKINNDHDARVMNMMQARDR